MKIGLAIITKKGTVMNHTQAFRLSPQGRIASAVSMALVLPFMSVSALADNIKPVGETSVSQVGNVDVVNIANPNSKGLSHNQYKDFNVSKSGAVLNNSLTAGKSQLAGQLDANSNLTGTASVILNEVVSKNPSLLLGQQEVFGMAADYVLANPNGITSEGGGFINTNRASLVVGTPNIAKERLESFNVGDRQSKTLTVSGDVNGAQRLDLLAPKVDINGNITATDAINVISGRNKVDYDTLEVSGLERSQPKVVLDGQILGSMQSGRIRLHNTDEKATQTLQGQFTAGQEFDATAANLAVVDSTIKGGSVDLTGRDNLSVGGDVTTARTDKEVTKEELEDRVTLTHSGYQETQAFNGSSIAGTDVALAGGDITVSGSQVTGDNISVSGETVDLSGVTTTDTDSTTTRNSKGLWFNEDETLNKTQQYHQSSLDAADQINVSSAADTSIAGTAINAKTVTVNTGGDLQASAETTENSQSQINRYKRETAALKSGAHTQTDATQAGHQTAINADSVALNSDGELGLEGVQLTADSAQLTADKGLSIAGTTTTNRQTDEEDFKYWGGIGGGETHIDNKQQTAVTGSQIKANNVSLASDTNVSVNASSVTADDTLDINAGEALEVANGFAKEQDYSEDRHGTAFNITDKKSATDRVATSAVASSLTAKNMSLTGDSVTVSGSDVSATDRLNVTANSELNTEAANATDITKTETYDIESGTEASLNVDLSQGLAAFDKPDLFESKSSIKGVTTLTTTGTGSARGNTLQAGNAELNAAEINLNGSDLTAAQNTTIRADNVTIGASEALTAVDSKVAKSTGPEAYIRGGVTGVEVGLSIGTDQIIDEHNEYQAVNSSVNAGESASLTATETLANKGAQITAADVRLSGQDITNEASYDRVVDRNVVAGGDAALTAFAGISPIIGGAVSLSGDGIGQTTEVKTAHTTAINADNTVTVDAANSAVDAGTQIKANSINIKADDYNGTSAYDSTVTTTHSGRGDVGVSASSSTLADVTIGVTGSGEYDYLQTGDAKAVKGQLNAKEVAINAGTRATAAQDVTADNYTLSAGEEARIGQNDDKQWTTVGGGKLGGSVGLTVIPATAAAGAVVGTPSFNGQAGFNYLSVEDSQAKTANVDAQKVAVTAQQLAQVDGATINADEVIIKGNRANIAAAQDNHRAVGVAMDGNTGFSLNIADTILSSDDIGVGGHLGVVNETGNKAHGATVNTSDLTVTANEADDALVVEGATIHADNVSLTNDNKDGNVAVIAAESRNKVGNVGIGGNVSANAGEGSFNTDNIGAHLNIESDNSQYYQLGEVNADRIAINTGKDVTLQSNIDAGSLQTVSGNDLTISSAQDVVRKVEVDTDLAVDGSPIQFIADAAKGDVLGLLKDDFNNGTILGVSAAGRAGLEVDHQQTTHHATVTADNLDASVGSNDIAVKAATVRAANSKLGDAKMKTTNNDDFVHNVGASVDAKTFSIPGFVQSIPSLVQDTFEGKPLDLPVHVDANFNWDDNDGANTKADVKL
ncbi:hypothetical protein DLE54_10785 [Psychrobacter sp. YP14]|nr:hypothetical protein DLE54_10785 [Psychrobacter sp. YP14]